jgi:hypothetical protein
MLNIKSFSSFTKDTNYVADPNKLNATEAGQKAKTDGNLAAPITNIRDEMKKKKKAGQ